MIIKLKTKILAALLAGLTLVSVNAMAAHQSAKATYVHNHHRHHNQHNHHRMWIPGHYVTHKVWIRGHHLRNGAWVRGHHIHKRVWVSGHYR